MDARNLGADAGFEYQQSQRNERLGMLGHEPLPVVNEDRLPEMWLADDREEEDRTWDRRTMFPGGVCLLDGGQWTSAVARSLSIAESERKAREVLAGLYAFGKRIQEMK